MSGAARWMIVVAAAGIVLLAAGCGQQPSGQTGAPTASNKISAMVPCGQVGPVSEALKLFEEANPELEVEWVPENMVPIIKQILDGVEKPDVFLSMGDLEVDLVEQAGLLVEETRTKYAENSLALMVPKGNPAGVQTVLDLTKPEVASISIPDPKMNSVGKHAVEALKRAGVWDRVADKVFIMSFAADSKDATAKRQVQASIGYYPCVVEVHVEGEEPAKPKNLELVGHVSGDLYDPFWCEGAVVRGSPNPEGGKKVLAFLTTPEVQEIFRKWQFVREAPASPAS